MRSATIAAAALLPLGASAHIHLLEPPSWIVESGYGDPQKIGPCGVENPTPDQLTGAVTTYHAGDVVHFRWTETIPHDGHFRVSLALTSRDELKDPPTTSDQWGNALTAEIQDPPVLPVLVDGALVHEAADISPGHEWTLDVTLPDVTCEQCTLQLTQFMAHHAPGYFYYHCVDVTILPKQGAAEPEPAEDVGPSYADIVVDDAGPVATPDVEAAPDPSPADAGPLIPPDVATSPDAEAPTPEPARSDDVAASPPPPGDLATEPSGSGGCSTTRPRDHALVGLAVVAVALVSRRRRAR